MPRYRTKGDTIAFRLPLELHEILVELAGDMTPTQYVQSLITDRLKEIHYRRIADSKGETP